MYMVWIYVLVFMSAVLAICIYFTRAYRQPTIHIRQIQLLRQLLAQVLYLDKAQKLSSKRIEDLVDTGQMLLEQSPGNQKLAYKVFIKQAQTLVHEYDNAKPARKRTLQHRILLHVIYLIDEVVNQGLLATNKTGLLEQYQCVWQAMMDAVNAKMRLSQAIYQVARRETSSAQSVKLHARILEKRTVQLTSACPKPYNDLSEEVIVKLSNLYQGNPDNASLPSLESLTLLTEDVDRVLFDHFDLALEEILDELEPESDHANAQPLHHNQRSN